MPQTRFVLKNALDLALKPIVLLNKIDKPAANPARSHDQGLELFLELGATDEQSDFPVIYSIGREGIAIKNLTDERKALTPLLDTILEKVPAANAAASADAPLMLQPFNLAYDNFMGRLAVGRIYAGTVRPNQQVFIKKPDGETRAGRTTKVFTFKGLERVEASEASAGDIALTPIIPTCAAGQIPVTP